MIRKSSLSILLVVIGFLAGLVVTGRLRTASDSRAAPVERTPAPPEQRPAPPPTPPSGPASGGGSISVGQDFTKIAGQAVKGVANISSVHVVRRSNSPFDGDPFFNY